MARALDLRLETGGLGWVLRMPGDLRLDDLHQAIQTVLGWDDHHPYVFEIADREFGPRPYRDEDDEEPDVWAGEARSLTVAQACTLAKGRFDYIYNFRDEARVRMTQVALQDQPVRTVSCVDGPDVDRVNRRLRAAFREQASPQFPAGPDASPERHLLAQLTLAVLHLGSRPTRRGVREASKTLRGEILDGLEEAGLIETAPDRKSVAFTEAGEEQARQLLERLRQKV